MFNLGSKPWLKTLVERIPEAIMPVIRRPEAPTFAVDHARASFVGLAAPSPGSQETSVCEVTVPAGEQGVTHSLDREEIFVVLVGRAVADVDGAAYELAAGDCLILPAQQSFSLSNPFG